MPKPLCTYCGEHRTTWDKRIQMHQACRVRYMRELEAWTTCACTDPIIEVFWGGRQCGDCGKPFLADLRPKAAA
jgi:hypothetical protein